MGEIKDGGPAYPFVSWQSPDGMFTVQSEMGMSLRDYFAAAALPAVIDKCAPQECLGGETMEQMFARKAFACADAMLAARNTSQGAS